MLRDKSLIPLSRQHQHALALCVRIDRALQAGEVELGSWQAEIQQIVEQEITAHFAAEEKEVFPVAEGFTDLSSLVAELKAEHEILRGCFAKARNRQFDREDLRRFGETLSQHIRKEERQLFERLQGKLNASDLSALGQALDRALPDTPGMCLLPGQKGKTHEI